MSVGIAGLAWSGGDVFPLGRANAETAVGGVLDDVFAADGIVPDEGGGSVTAVAASTFGPPFASGN